MHLNGFYHVLYSFRTHRYSGDFTDTGQMKTGQNNNGYVANAADYSPPSQSTLLLRNGSSNTSSDTTYYPNGQVPSVNSTLTRNSRSTTVDSRQDVGLPNVHGSFNSLQNSLLSEYFECISDFLPVISCIPTTIMRMRAMSSKFDRVAPFLS